MTANDIRKRRDRLERDIAADVADAIRNHSAAFEFETGEVVQRVVVEATHSAFDSPGEGVNVTAKVQLKPL